MRSKPTIMEAITIRKANVADTDKVRYRVYSTPTEFIAVIAESALMAVKVSGVKKPHKIVRDLPTEGVAIEAKKMAAIDEAAARIKLPIKQMERPEQLTTQVKDIDPNLKQMLFKPMNIGDLQNKRGNRARILPPDLVHEIIEQHMAQPAAKLAEPAPTAPPVVTMPEPEPEPVVVQPEMTPQERLMEAAQHVIPPAAELAEAETDLSPEEVAKLLNG